MYLISPLREGPSVNFPIWSPPSSMLSEPAQYFHNWGLETLPDLRFRNCLFPIIVFLVKRITKGLEVDLKMVVMKSKFMISLSLVISSMILIMHQEIKHGAWCPFDLENDSQQALHKQDKNRNVLLHMYPVHVNLLSTRASTLGANSPNFQGKQKILM